MKSNQENALPIFLQFLKMRKKRPFFSSIKNHKILFGVRNSEDIQYLQCFQMRFSKTIKMVICGACGQCRECLDRKLTNACPLSNPRISRQASLRYLCNYMKRWNTWPLTRFSLHVFSQLNWLATDIRKKKVCKKDLEKVKGGKRSWLFCYRRSRAFNFVVHAIHIYQAMTDRQQQQKWTKGLNYSTAVSANEYKTQTHRLPKLIIFLSTKKKSPFPLIFRICRKIGNAFSWFDFMPRIIVTDFFRF